MTTRFHAEKTTRWREGETAAGEKVSGYEIHHGEPVLQGAEPPWFFLEDDHGPSLEGVSGATTGVWGTSLHGILENDQVRTSLLRDVALRRGKPFTASGLAFAGAREQMADRLADAVEVALDLGAIFSIIAEAAPPLAHPGPLSPAKAPRP